jgi:hypothetical protein
LGQRDWMTDEPFDTPPEDPRFTTGDFHSIAQKQILNAVYSALADAKLDWQLIQPFLDAARALLLADIEENAQVRLHTLRAEGDIWVDAEEAFLGISVSDREEGKEWLSETWWLSEVALADEDPAEVRRILAALERSTDKIKAWLADKEGTAPAP